MPGVALHLTVARRALDALRASGGRVPFDPERASDLNAFHHGAIGPDLGYFPGGHRALSDLAHCVRTGALTRALIRRARRSEEHAFAWGWLTHVLADREIHPWIGKGVGEIVAGCRRTFIDGSSRPLEHLRVEMGVDAWFATRCEHVRGTRLEPVFDESGIGYLVRAYATTYGVAIPGSWFLASHRAAGVRASQGLATIGVIGALMEEGGTSPLLDGVRWLLRTAYAAAPLRGLSLAYLNPVPPARWLLMEIRAVLDDLPGRIADTLLSGARSLADHNLDTGQLSVIESDHAGTERALDALRDLMAARGVAARPSAAPTRSARLRDPPAILEA